MACKRSPVKAPISISNGGRRLNLEVIWDQGREQVYLSGVKVSADVNVTKIKVIKNPQLSGTQGICTIMRQIINSAQGHREIPVLIPERGRGFHARARAGVVGCLSWMRKLLSLRCLRRELTDSVISLDMMDGDTGDKKIGSFMYL